LDEENSLILRGQGGKEVESVMNPTAVRHCFILAIYSERLAFRTISQGQGRKSNRGGGPGLDGFVSEVLKAHKTDVGYSPSTHHTHDFGRIGELRNYVSHRLHDTGRHTADSVSPSRFSRMVDIH
jgi:hypothetical protein